MSRKKKKSPPKKSTPPAKETGLHIEGRAVGHLASVVVFLLGIVMFLTKAYIPAVILVILAAAGLGVTHILTGRTPRRA